MRAECKGLAQYNLQSFIKSGRIDVVSWARQTIGPSAELRSALAFYAPWKRVNLPLIKWLAEQGLIQISSLQTAVVRSGSVEMVQFAVQEGARMSQRQIIEAGSLSVAKLLHETYRIPFPYDYAPDLGTVPLALVQYFHEKGWITKWYRGGIDPSDDALHHCRPDLLRWCVSNGFPLRSLDSYYLDGVFREERADVSLEMLEILYSDPARKQVVSKCVEEYEHRLIRPKLWRYLRLQGAVPNDRAFLAAINSSSFFALETVQYLLEEVKLAVPKDIQTKIRRRTPFCTRPDVKQYLMQVVLQEEEK